MNLRAISLAKKLFAAFQGRAPEVKEIVYVSVHPQDVALVIGSFDGIIYTASGDGKKYIHRFRKDARPVLAVSHDGKQIYALAGAYRFSERGFVDASRSGPRRKK